MFARVSTLFLVAATACARQVNYGSVIQLENVPTSMRLFSMGKITWGNGGQIVSGIPSNQVGNELEAVSWIVRSPTTGSSSLNAKSLLYFVSQSDGVNKTDVNAAFEAKPSGSPIPCNSIVRLEHSLTAKNLYAQKEAAPITENYEVVGFAAKERANEGNTDFFKVVCTAAKSETWNTEEVVYLRHVNFGGYLNIEKRAVFNERNCPRCPIQKHGEVSVSKSREVGAARTSEWKAHTVMAVSLTEEDLEEDDGQTSRDEL